MYEPSDLIEISETNLAMLLIAQAHKGQTDKAGQPYTEHLYRVSAQMQKQADEPAALLHDILEDTDVTESSLRSVFSERTVDAVVIVTRRDYETYGLFIDRVVESRNELAIRVKHADVLDHLQDTRYISPGLVARYESAAIVLKQAVESFDSMKGE